MSYSVRDMLNPQTARSIDECVDIAASLADEYPICLGWQLCLEPLLPPLPEVVSVDGKAFRHCLAFLVDEELGPHYVFHVGDEDDEPGLAEVLVSEVGFREPLSEIARLWLRAFNDWRDGRTHRRRKPLRLV